MFFRRKESETLDRLLLKDEDFVLATGGGTPCYGTAMERIKTAQGVTSVYLQAGIDVLTQRLFPEIKKRPLIAHLPNTDALRDFIRKHIFERTHYYLRSDIKVDAAQDPPSVVQQIVLRLF